MCLRIDVYLGHGTCCEKALLQGKYHATLQDKVKLQRQLRTLQDKLHEIHLQQVCVFVSTALYYKQSLVLVSMCTPPLSHVQVETLSSVITNTTRADQMNRRVWESLDKALNTKQSTSKSSSAEVRPCSLIVFWAAACTHSERIALGSREGMFGGADILCELESLCQCRLRCLLQRTRSFVTLSFRPCMELRAPHSFPLLQRAHMLTHMAQLFQMEVSFPGSQTLLLIC